MYLRANFTCTCSPLNKKNINNKIHLKISVFLSFIRQQIKASILFYGTDFILLRISFLTTNTLLHKTYKRLNRNCFCYHATKNNVRKIYITEYRTRSNSKTSVLRKTYPANLRFFILRLVLVPSCRIANDRGFVQGNGWIALRFRSGKVTRRFRAHGKSRDC